jgi:hypothetical protein
MRLLLICSMLLINSLAQAKGAENCKVEFNIQNSPEIVDLLLEKNYQPVSEDKDASYVMDIDYTWGGGGEALYESLEYTVTMNLRSNSILEKTFSGKGIALALNGQPVKSTGRRAYRSLVRDIRKKLVNCPFQ